MRSLIPRDISSLSTAELQLEVARCTWLRKNLSLRLPDGGAKLIAYLEQLNNALSSRSQEDLIKGSPRPLPIVDEERIAPVVSHVAETTANVDSNALPQESLDSAGTDICDHFANLSIQSPDGFESDLDWINLPALTLDELNHIQDTLNLPLTFPSSWRWFVFSLRFIGRWVYLTILDCASVDRYLLRTGLHALWFPQVGNKKEHVTKVVSFDPPSHLCSPADAVSDLWQFLTACDDADKSLMEDRVQTKVPCLICCSAPSAPVTDLVWFSRLLRTVRHSVSARTSMPRDCRFVDVGIPATDITPALHGPDLTMAGDPRDIFVGECRSLARLVFSEPLTSCEGLKPKLFETVYDFFRTFTTRGLPWMEAPLELHALSQMKACGYDPSLPLSPRPEGTPTLDCVPDHILRRLAAVGLGRARLIRLVAHYGWRGFAGLLTFNITTLLGPRGGKPNIDGRALVTNDPEIVRHLYRFFHHIHRRLERHTKLREEQRDAVSMRFHPWRGRQDTSIRSSDVVNRNMLQAWTSGGNPVLNAATSERRVLCLDMDTSIKLMQKTYKEYQEACVKQSRVQLRLPPPSDKLGSYRDGSLHHPYLESTGSQSESSSSDSEASLHLEDVD